MGKIVVNKHFDEKSQIKPESFAHKGELIISNQVGYEGIFIKNKNGDIFFISPTEGTGSDIPTEYKEYIEGFINGRLEDYITEDVLSAYTTTEYVSSAITSSVSGLATETWVKQEIMNAELGGSDIVLSDYVTKYELNEKNFATEGFVADKISEIEFPETDLTGYATEQWVKNQEYLTEHQDISHLVDKETLKSYTAKDYVDGEIGKIKLGYVSKNEISGYTVSRDEIKQIASEEIADIIADSEESLETLKEIADWIANDTTGAASMANDIQNLKAQLNALTLGAKATASVSSNIICKGEDTEIVVVGKMTPETLTPCEVIIKKGDEIVASADTHTVSYTDTISDSSSYKIEAKYNGMEYSARTSVNAYYKTYYGFGSDYGEVFENGNSKLTSSANGTYSETSLKNGVYYFIIVPDGVAKPNNFTMGGAPFNMSSSTDAIDGVIYTIYKSGSLFNNGGSVNISAS